MITAFHAACAAWFFALGSVVGSFLNVCIYRIPWQKSVVWPDSRCPRCLNAIAARDNVPILGWIALRGECRRCKLPISARYPLVEALVGLLFLAVYCVDVWDSSTPLSGEVYARLAYHLALVALLVAATFIDYDLQVIPDQVTGLGMAVGLLGGALDPTIRPAPSTASGAWGMLGPALISSAAGMAAGAVMLALYRLVFGPPTPRGPDEPPPEGFGPVAIGGAVGWQAVVLTRPEGWGSVVIGVQGMIVGAALIYLVSVLGRLVFRREAMGFGDVTLLAMIGAFLGWQAAVLTFFLAPFFGLAHAVAKLGPILARWFRGTKSPAAAHEMPFGPYLSMAALFLLLGWPRLWAGWAGPMFGALGALARALLDGEF